VTVVTESPVIRNFVVIFIAIYVVYGELALMLREKVTVFAILFLVKQPGSFYMAFCNFVPVMTPVVLYLIWAFFVRLFDTHTSTTH